MQLKSEIRVGALVRTIQAHNGAAYIRRRGHPQAGDIILVVIDKQTRQKCLYQRIMVGEETQFKRVEEISIKDNDYFQAELELDICEKALERVVKFDPDIWIVDIEAKGFDEGWLG